ncbi:MAG TPA: hypothetical protein VFH78_12410 [Candidatus Thermoplasmatota archaeon]|nr:hypothetical protein [Candidatus Thermoplasmatota archaeon]
MSWNETHRDALMGALESAFGMEREDAREIADVVLERFTDRDEVDDETLDAEVRSVFYTLEAKRLLSFRRAEYTREDGDHRRAFYWRLRVESLQPQVPMAGGYDEADVYASLPATAWRHAA